MDQPSLQIEQLIGGILTPDDNREAAQATYFQIQNSNPTELFRCLGIILQHSTIKPARLFAAIILRQQSLPSKELINSVNPEIITQLKTTALYLFQNEPDAMMRRKVIEFAAVFAARLFKQSQSPNPSEVWPEILQLTVQGASLTAQPAIQASCFDMLGQIGEFSVQVFNNQEQAFVQLFSAAINPTSDITVAIAASSAVLSILVSYQQLHNELVQPHIPLDQPKVEMVQNAIAAYSSAVKPVCEVFARALNEQKENLLNELIHQLDQVISANPGAFNTSFTDLIQLIATIVKHPDLEPSFREKSLSLLVRFGTTPSGRSLARKTPLYQQTMVSIGFQFLLDIDNSEQWGNDPLYATQDEEDWPNFHLGLFIMNSLPTTLGTKTFLTPLLQEVFQRAQQTSWKQQHAALNVLTLICESHLKSIPKPAIAPIQNMLAALMNPKVASRANPRVIVACMIAIAAFAPKLGQKTGLTILPHVLAFLPTNLEALTKIPTTLVYYATRSISIFIGLLTKPNLTPHVPRLLESIVICLSHSNSTIVTSALSGLSTAAMQLGEDFSQYSDNMMTGLCNLIAAKNAQLKTYLEEKKYKSDDDINTAMQSTHNIRNKAIESISFIAEALGHDHFTKYSTQAMTLISESQALEMVYPNPSLEMIFGAFTKIADCLQEDFGPFLPSILPGILSAASAADFHFRFDLDSDSNLSYQDQVRFEELQARGFSSIVVGLHGSGTQRVAINAAVVSDKIQALEILGEFAISLKSSFGPFLQQTAAVLFPECVSTQNPRIRWSATTTIPALLECLYSQPGITQDNILSFFNDCISAFQLPIWIEKELPEGLSHLLQATTASIDALYQAGIHAVPDSSLQIISDALLKAWKMCLERRHSIEQEVMVGDEEQIELKSEAVAIENQALDACVSLNSQLIKSNKEKYWPFFMHFVEPLYASAIGSDNEVTINNTVIKRDPYLNVCGLVGYADAIGCGGSLGAGLISKIFPTFMLNATHPTDAELRRGAAYGITACHRALTMAEFAQFVPAALDTLAKSAAIEYEQPVGEDYDDEAAEDAFYAADNALAGLSDIMTRFGCGFPLPNCNHSPSEQANFTTAVQPYLNTGYINQYMEAVLDKLARFHDEDEANNVHNNFCVWLKNCPQTVYGENNQNLPHVIRIIAHILDLAQEYPIISDENLDALRDVWRKLRVQLPHEVVAKILAIIDKDIVDMLDFQ
jgi:hypothetical protein